MREDIEEKIKAFCAKGNMKMRTISIYYFTTINDILMIGIYVLW